VARGRGCLVWRGVLFSPYLAIESYRLIRRKPSTGPDTPFPVTGPAGRQPYPLTICAGTSDSSSASASICCASLRVSAWVSSV
jgi:hypothetical protein